MKRILVVAAHADDETLGCGGTIARHVTKGDAVTVMFMTDGVASRSLPDDFVEKRKMASAQAMSVLGVEDIRQLAFPDNQMDSVPLLDIVQVIEAVISSVKPEIIYTHFAHDLNIDHQITHQAVLTACRPQLSCPVNRILSFEVLSSTEWNSPALNRFQPQYIVDIGAYWQKKVKALQCYDQEIRDYPHSRSYKAVEALATLRGAMFGCDMAEGFYVERIIER